MKISPRKANTEKKLCKLQRDNIDSGQVSILVSEKHISIWKDKTSGYFSIPKRNFNRIIDWYNKDQQYPK